MKIRNAIIPALLISLVPALSCPAQSAGTAVQQKAQELKQSVAANRAALKKYQWIQTVQFNLKGETKKDSTSACRYGPDGKVEKTPVGPPPQQQAPPQRGIKGRIVEKKMAEMQDYTTRLKSLISHYAPPDPDTLQAAIQAGNVSLTPSSGSTTITVVNYYKPGDKVTFVFDPATKKLRSYSVDTYLDDPKNDIVTLQNTFATLPSGANYVQQTVLNAPAKHIQVITTNSNYTLITQ